MNVLKKLAESATPNKKIFSNSHQSFSNNDVLDKCEKFLNYLNDRKLQNIAICADNSLDWLIVDLVCQQNGKCLIPLPTWFTEEQIEHAFVKTATTHILLDDLAVKHIPKNGELEDVAGTGLKLMRVSGTDKPCIPIGTGKITFTSGSTAAPKGVCLSHGQQINQAIALCNAVSIKSPKHLCLLPLSTLLENVAGLYAPLLADGEVVVPSLKELGYSGSSLQNPRKMLDMISSVQPDTMILVPELLKLLISAIEAGWKPPETLKFIAVGGAHVPRRLLEKAAEMKLPVYEGYGISECCSVVTLNTFANSKLGSCGLPLQNHGVFVENDQIYVTGNVMLGYVGLPDSWFLKKFKTGDLGAIDEEGHLYLRGRASNQIISSFGRNISPEWIEAKVLVHQGISECLIVGDSRPHCVALFTKRDVHLTDNELDGWISSVNETLPDYAQIKNWKCLSTPFWESGDLITDNGKLRRNEIISRFQEQIECLYQFDRSPKLIEAGERNATV